MQKGDHFIEHTGPYAAKILYEYLWETNGVIRARYVDGDEDLPAFLRDWIADGRELYINEHYETEVIE